MHKIVALIMLSLLSFVSYSDDKIDTCMAKDGNEYIKDLLTSSMRSIIRDSYGKLEIKILTPIPSLSKVQILNTDFKLNSRIPFDLLVMDCHDNQQKRLLFGRK